MARRQVRERNGVYRFRIVNASMVEYWISDGALNR
jgi:hypothetical protein